MSKLENIKTSIKSKKSTISEYLKKGTRTARYKRIKSYRRARDKETFPAYPNCKNCGAELVGMYCAKCGQYALDINQPFFRYVTEYFSNAYQYDGRLPSTVKLLFFRPGKLTSEFEAGKINSYVHPLKLYMFISIVFFSIILAFVPAMHQDDFLVKTINEVDSTVLSPVGDSLQKAKSLADLKLELSKAQMNLSAKSDNGTATEADKQRVNRLKLAMLEVEGLNTETDKDNSNSKKIVDIWTIIKDGIQKMLPIIMICMLPLYAFILRFFYRKRQKKYLLCFVYSIHLQSVIISLIAFMVIINLIFASDVFDKILAWIFYVYFLIYIIAASRYFFKEKWWKSVIKGPLSFFTYFFLCLCVVIAMFVWEMSVLYGG